jgi:hypothetical protein
MTSENSPEQDLLPMELPSMSSAGGSRARTYLSLANDLALRARDLVSGSSSLGSLASYDHASSSWRTRQACLVSGWEMFSESWPRAGMTRNGNAYQQAPLVPHTSASVFGSLPTLTRRDRRTLKGGRDRPNRNGGKSLLQTFLDDGHTDGRINPRWAEWFMGFPQMWTLLERSEIPSPQSSPSSSAKRSSKRKEDVND